MTLTTLLLALATAQAADAPAAKAEVRRTVTVTTTTRSSRPARPQRPVRPYSTSRPSAPARPAPRPTRPATSSRSSASVTVSRSSSRRTPPPARPVSSRTVIVHPTRPPAPVIVPSRPATRTVVVVQTPPPPPRVVAVASTNVQTPPVTSEFQRERHVARGNTWALGVSMGSLVSGSRFEGMYGDFGLGLTGRYRPTEHFGIEVAGTYYDNKWNADSTRRQGQLSASAMAFAVPWAKVTPFVVGGLTTEFRNVALQAPGEGAGFVQSSGTLFGPHIGGGLEFNFGRHVALDIDARYAYFVNVRDIDPSHRGALTANATVLWHF